MALIVNTLPSEQSINSSLGSVEPKIESATEKQGIETPSSSAFLKDWGEHTPQFLAWANAG